MHRSVTALPAAARALSTSPASRRVVFVDGVRIPFKLSGTAYKDLIAQDLGRLAIKGLLTKTAIDPSIIDYCLYGTVIQEGACDRVCLCVGRGACVSMGVLVTAQRRDSFGGVAIPPRARA